MHGGEARHLRGERGAVALQGAKTRVFKQEGPTKHAAAEAWSRVTWRASPPRAVRMAATHETAACSCEV